MPFLDDYTLLLEVGRGGFATVYKVRHNQLGYVRAIRVLNEMVPDERSELWRKFIEECRILLRLGNGNHPNIVHIYQPRLIQNKAFIEMDYVDGDDLTTLVKDRKHFVSVEDVLRMAMQISSALQYCHEDIYRFCMDRTEDNLRDDPNDGRKVLMDEPTRHRLIEKYKVIHNDIHSGNIICRENGDFVLLDFGLAITGSDVVRSSRRRNGAPEYKPPEKWDNESLLNEQSDIYSFGVVLYEMLAGQVPFPMDTRIPSYKAESFVAEAHKNSPVPPILPLRQKAYEAKFVGRQYVQDYPAWLEEVILKCLSKNPADRYANGRELHAAVAAGMAQMRDLQVESLQVAVTRIEKERDTLQQQLQQIEGAQQDVNDALQQREDDIAKKQEKLNVAQAELKVQAATLAAERKRQDTVQNDLKKKAAALETESQRQNERGQALRMKADELELERRELKKTVEKPIRKWRAVSVILLVLFLLCGAGTVYVWKAAPKGTDSTGVGKTDTKVVDSLQRVIGDLNSKISDMESSADGNTAALLEQVNELKEQNQQLKQEKAQLQSENASLKEKNKYKNLTAEQWATQKCGNKTAEQWKKEDDKRKANSKFNGQSAEHWYKKLKGKEAPSNWAQYWYNKYMGYDK